MTTTAQYIVILVNIHCLFWALWFKLKEIETRLNFVQRTAETVVAMHRLRKS